MKMRLIVPAILAIALAPGVALAQSSGSGTTSSTPSASATHSQSLPQQIQQKLKDQGFTDVKVVPGSFLISAKDKQGDPVTMIIGPNTMTVFTVSSAEESNTGTAEQSKNQTK